MVCVLGLPISLNTILTALSQKYTGSQWAELLVFHHQAHQEGKAPLATV